MFLMCSIACCFKVIVDDCDNMIVYEFPCGRWFADDEDDGALFRDLIPGVGVSSSYGGQLIIDDLNKSSQLCG